MEPSAPRAGRADKERLDIYRYLGPVSAAGKAGEPPLTLTLPFEMRRRSRMLTRLDNGREAGLVLERGTVLRHGDGLLAADGTRITVCAAEEAVSTVSTDDAESLARAGYHLGNRHVPLQVGPGWVRYRADHVLDDLVRGLGLVPRHGLAPFEPEAGAYGGAHSHGEHHDHDHEHGEAHSHGHAEASDPGEAEGRGGGKIHRFGGTAGTGEAGPDAAEGGPPHA